MTRNNKQESADCLDQCLLSCHRSSATHRILRVTRLDFSALCVRDEARLDVRCVPALAHKSRCRKPSRCTPHRPQQHEQHTVDCPGGGGEKGRGRGDGRTGKLCYRNTTTGETRGAEPVKYFLQRHAPPPSGGAGGGGAATATTSATAGWARNGKPAAAAATLLAVLVAEDVPTRAALAVRPSETLSLSPSIQVTHLDTSWGSQGSRGRGISPLVFF